MEVNLRPILTILFLLSLCGAEKVVITRNKNYNPPPLPQSNIKINLVAPKGVETKSPQMLKTTHFFKEFGLPR
ncbi:MAG: hypothetical protein ABIL18_01070, partial [candidate division WOR-3 bacterium]